MEQSYTVDRSPRPSAASDAAETASTAASAKTATSAEDATAPARQSEIGRGVRLAGVASTRETLLQARRAFARGDDAVALAMLRRIVAHGARFADVHYMLGLLLERRGELDEALGELREAVRINPSYVEALLALASLHERRGEYDRSQGYAERASQLARATAGELDATTRGKLANQQADLGDALAEAGERRAAIEQYRGALDRCPTFHDVRLRLGVTLREAGLPAQAAREFQRILAQRPSYLDSRIQLGLTWYSMGRTPEAIAEWEAVLEQDPSRDAARMYLRLVRGRLASQEAAAAARTATDSPRAEDADAEEGSEDTLRFRAVEPTPDASSPATGWRRTGLARGRDE